MRALINLLLISSGIMIIADSVVTLAVHRYLTFTVAKESRLMPLFLLVVQAAFGLFMIGYGLNYGLFKI